MPFTLQFRLVFMFQILSKFLEDSNASNIRVFFHGYSALTHGKTSITRRVLNQR